MNIRTCSDCRYEKEDASSEVCTNCHGIIKGEPSNWKNKSCLVCVNFGKGVHIKPCKDCIYNKYKPSFELDKKENKEMEEIKTCDNWKAPLEETEGNNSDTKFIRCAVCKYRYKDMDAEPCNSCVNIGRGDKCKGEEVNCRECKYASVNINEEPCKNCSKNSRNSQIVSNLYFEPITAHCYDCKHISKCIDESPCNECCEVYMGEDCKWEGVYCEDCKYVEVDVDAKPCNKCSNNDCISKETRATLSLCFEEPESKQEDEELQEEIASHDSKQGDFLDIEKRTEEAIDNLNGFVPRLGTTEGNKYIIEDKDGSIEEASKVFREVAKEAFKALSERFEREATNGTPSCCTCKHFETNSNNEPCSKCVAICNGIASYWEEKDEETKPQTAREVVEKTVEQRLQEEHFDEHYHDKVQPLEIMQEIMTPEEFRGFLFGNIIKYSCRCGKKDEPQKEFAKLRRYREWYDKSVLCEHIDPRI